MLLGINLFGGKPSFVDKKKMDEKDRFGEPFTEEIKEIMDNIIPVTTKKLQSSRLDYLAIRIRTVSFKSRDFTHS